MGYAFKDRGQRLRCQEDIVERWIPPDPSRLPPEHDPFELSDALSHQLVREEVERVETSDQLVLAEGVETALSASLIFDRRPAWAKCSGLSAEMWLPECVRHVLICADNDPRFNKNGKPRVTSEDRARKLRAFIRASERRCEIVIPETVGHDFNDELLRRAVG